MDQSTADALRKLLLSREWERPLVRWTGKDGEEVQAVLCGCGYPPHDNMAVVMLPDGRLMLAHKECLHPID